MELSDEDILAAMANISGYLDITTEDFRTLYHLAHQRAVQRLFAHIRADRLMRRGIDPIAAAFQHHDGRATPVVDGAGRLMGLVLRRDFIGACKLPGAI